jgi:dihydroorotate dehydrogenase electron transfer subunit
VSVAEAVVDIESNSWVNSDYKHLVVAAAQPALSVRAGQFFHLLCPAAGSDAPYLRRPLSIYRPDPGTGRLEFLYRVSGAGTRALASLAAGDTVDMLGPLGAGFAPAGARHVLILARGVGLATMAPLAEMAAAQGARVTAILSARAPQLIMSAGYLREFGATVHAVDDETGTSGVRAVEATIRAVHAAHPIDFVSTCGSNRLLQLLQRLGREFGLRGQVALEQQMACGIGSCYCCVRGFVVAGTLQYRRVCCEGPVFDLHEVTSW